MTFYQTIRHPFACIDEIATYLGVCPSTIRRRIKDGTLPATKIGKQIRIKWSDVDALTASGKVIPNPRDQQCADLDGND